ncbi:hypothetical protein X946_5234 [Burkholderia sp. ABCPW 111]|nr:hypothetical protein X946_5234 [Burkholderia sp. ABCPW 111]
MMSRFVSRRRSTLRLVLKKSSSASTLSQLLEPVGMRRAPRWRGCPDTGAGPRPNRTHGRASLREIPTITERRLSSSDGLDFTHFTWPRARTFESAPVLVISRARRRIGASDQLRHRTFSGVGVRRAMCIIR